MRTTTETAGETMSQDERITALANALAAWEVAHERAADAVRLAFPLETDLTVPRGTGVLRGWVSGHGPAWSRPFEVQLTLWSTERPVWVDVRPLIPPAPATLASSSL